VRKLQVWIVDDSDSDVYLIQLALSKTGVPMEVKPFSNGDQAIDAIAACQENQELVPDIVLLDMHLPGMDGLEILSAIRAAAHFPNVRVGVFGQPPEHETMPAADCYRRKVGDLDEFIAEIEFAVSQLRPVA